MSFLDDLKAEVKEALPELKDAFKKEIKEQISKRTSEQAAPSGVQVNIPASLQSSMPIIAIGALVLFLVLRK